MNNSHAYLVENSGFLLVFQQGLNLHSLEYPAFDELFPRLRDSTLECLSKITSQGAFNIGELEKLYEVSALGELNSISEDVLTSFKYGAVHGGIYEACKDIQGIEQSYKKSEALSNDIYNMYDLSPCFSKLTEEIDGRSFLFYGILLDSLEPLGQSINSLIHCFDNVFENETPEESVKEAQPKKENEYGEYLKIFFEAIENNDIDALDKAIAFGVDVDSNDENGDEPLALAMYYESMEAAKKLIELKGKIPQYYLDWAAQMDRPKYLKLFLNDDLIIAGRGAIRSTIESSSFIEKIVKADKASCLEALLDYGLSVDHPINTNGMIFDTIKHESTSCFSVLLAHHAKTEEKYFNNTLFGEVLKIDNKEMLDLLIKHGKCGFGDNNDGAQVIEVFLNHCTENNISIIDALKLYNVELHDFNGEFTLLQTASKSNNLEFALALIELGVDIDTKTQDRRHCALSLVETEEMFRLLISHGADINNRMIMGSTPKTMIKENNPQLATILSL